MKPIQISDYKNSKQRVEKLHYSPKNSSNNGGGGNDMSNFVTREELHRELDKLEDKINLRFDSIEKQLTNLPDIMSDKMKLALHEKAESDRKESKETRRFVVGTIILGGLSLVVSVIGIIISILS